ncbi:hypothetical protein KAR91_54370 [Candidatus Pacearchaeota archaeon]|nr:hypothetical protein [Candidatus Pacearchaeota archaeon]
MRPINIKKTVAVGHMSMSSEFAGEQKVLATTLKLGACFQIEDIVEIFDAEAFNIKVFKSLYWDEKGDRLSEADHVFKFAYGCKGLRFELFRDTAIEDAPHKSVFLSMDTKVSGFIGKFTVGHQLMLDFSVYFRAKPEDMCAITTALNETRMITIEPLTPDMLEGLD